MKKHILKAAIKVSVCADSYSASMFAKLIMTCKETVQYEIRLLRLATKHGRNNRELIGAFFPESAYKHHPPPQSRQ